MIPSPAPAALPAPPPAAAARPEPAPDTAAAWTFAVSLLLLVWVGRARLFQDPGTFWHVLVGERILAEGLPRTDWLTFTFEGAPWIAQQWLAEVAMAVLHRAGGLDALLVATAAVAAAVLGPLQRRLVAAGVSVAASTTVVALVFLATSHHLHVRPHVVSIALFAIVLGRLADLEAGRIGVRGLLILPVAFVAWVNCHGGALGGLATLGLAIAGFTALHAAGRPSPLRTRRDVLAAWAIAAACAATVFASPYGAALPRAWATILSSSAVRTLVVEHGSLVRTGTWQVLPLAAAYLLALGLSPGAPVVTTAVVPLAWLALAFDRVRHAPLFAVAAAIAMAGAIPRAPRLWRLLGSGPPSARRPAAARWAPVLLTVTALGAAAVVHARGAGPALVSLEAAGWPVSLAAPLREAAARRPQGAPILNDYDLGGFVEWSAPRLRVFVDDRCELFGDAFLFALDRAEAGWLDGWIARRDVDLALARPGSRLDQHLRRRGWRPAGIAATAVLYERAPLPRRGQGP